MTNRFHLAIPAGDLDLAINFYCDVLGCNRGKAEFKYPDAWAARERDVWNYIISGGGENYPALAARVGEWLDEQPANLRIVLISHGQTGRALRFRYCGLTPKEALNLPVPQNIVFRLFEGRSDPLNAAF